jgi:RNA polymerase sigma-70 factor (ECF subfamily)
VISGRRPSPKENEANREEFQKRLALFEELILPHLDAAYNLARWLTRNEQDVPDIVQEAYLRAFGYFDSYRGGDGKAWLLAVVRNTCRTWQHRQSKQSASVPFDEFVHTGEDAGPDYEREIASQEKMGLLRTCLESLPVEFRAVVVMRELEEMSYQEIAEAMGLAIGTIMSRLSRARKRLMDCAGRAMRAAG